MHQYTVSQSLVVVVHPIFATRWEDSLDSFAKSRGFKWQEVARDHDVWWSWKSTFVDDDENGEV